MTQTDLIKRIAEENGISASKAKQFLQSTCGIIRENILTGEEVTLPELGKFSKKLRNERRGINPKTKETITIPAREVVVFKVTKSLK